MTGPNGSDGHADPAPDESVWPYIGVGCFTMIVGLFGGGMIAMLIGKVVDGITGCRPPDGLPVCMWWRYWWAGAVLGVVILPIIAVRRLRQGRKPSAQPTSN